MKNKKLIATVASLCLVLVAVVAAVVGVLAAAQQNVKSKIKVAYIATNVKATVSIEGKKQLDADYGTPVSQSFTAGEASTTKEASLDAINLGWVSNELNYYAVYRFTFTNTSTNNDMEVYLTYTAPSAETNKKNVTLAWFSGTDSAPTFNVGYQADATNINTTNPITASAATGKTCASIDPASEVKALDVSKSNAVGYVYLVVAISNTEINANLDLTGEDQPILFRLQAVAV